LEKRVLRRIFGPEKYEETGKWKKIRNEDFKKLYSLPNIIQVIKSIRIKLGACSICGREERCIRNLGMERTTWKTQA
jgi:hypothetical protein